MLHLFGTQIQYPKYIASKESNTTLPGLWQTIIDEQPARPNYPSANTKLANP